VKKASTSAAIPQARDLVPRDLTFLRASLYVAFHGGVEAPGYQARRNPSCRMG
jgi:hypothetical protein